MPSFPPEIVALLSCFANTCSVPAFRKALVLLAGVILSPGRRTITAALRACGLADDAHFTNFHRLVNRDQWSPWLLSGLLLALIVRLCLPDGAPLRLIVDETLERRWAYKIAFMGWHRDPVRSMGSRLVMALGLRWFVMAIAVPVPWSKRCWALPFCVVPLLSSKTSMKLRKPHRTPLVWAQRLVTRIRRQYPEREIILAGDGTYAAISLIHVCQSSPRPVRLVSRLRLDAALYAPPPATPRKRGRPAKKGQRLRRLADLVADPTTQWQRLVIAWYGGQQKAIDIITGTALWYHSGEHPAPIRWVVIRDPSNPGKPVALFCSDVTATVTLIIAWFITRWAIEVTMAEMRAHLGVETQRYWSQRATERTTPCLFGVFSIVVLAAIVLHPTGLPVRQSAWYPKTEATFSDALAAVRRCLWTRANIEMSAAQADNGENLRDFISSIVDIACYAT